MGIIKNEIRGTNEILKRIKDRDFSGNEGMAIKNSSWQIATNLTAKFGSILFTIVMARIMLPELYGLYGLALSTILFIGVLSDLGISSTMTRFLSKIIDKDPGKAKGYLIILTKYKMILTIISSIMILSLAKWLANSFYDKPIYYALVAGAVYLPITVFSGHLNSVFVSKNNFKPQFTREIIIQISRLTIIPLSIVFLIKTSSQEWYILFILLLLSICYIIGGLYIFILLKISHPFKRRKEKRLSHKEKKELFLFILPLSATALSGLFFGYIDQIMLGHYVESKFLGFYQVAFNLIASASSIIAFSSLSLFPIFSRLKGERLKRAFRKSMNITILISIAAMALMLFLAPVIIRVIYGEEYTQATIYLRLLSLLLISFPLISLYSSYYSSQGKTNIMAILLIISTILNIILNYILINAGLKISMSQAVTGACVGTIIARYFYLSGLFLFKKI